MLKWLLVFVPVAVALEYLTPQRHLLIFVTAAIAILPLAAGSAGPPNNWPIARAKGLAVSSMRLSATPPSSSSHSPLCAPGFMMW